MKHEFIAFCGRTETFNFWTKHFPLLCSTFNNHFVQGTLARARGEEVEERNGQSGEEGEEAGEEGEEGKEGERRAQGRERCAAGQARASLAPTQQKRARP